MKQNIYKNTFAQSSQSYVLALLLGCCLFLLSNKVARADISQKDQVQCLTRLAWFQGINANQASLPQAVKNNTSSSFSLQKLQKAAVTYGMKVIDRKIPLANLRKMNVPAIARLSHPDELVTIAAIGQQNAIVYKDATLQVMPVKVLSQRYDGESLIYKDNLSHKPQISIDEPIIDVKVKKRFVSFPFIVPVKNMGTQNVTLKVQSTSCGCTSDDKSDVDLKPGQSGELRFKTSAFADRMVSAVIATNDPVRPVFVLAFQIKVPDFCEACGF